MGVEIPLLFFFKDDSNFYRSGVAAKQALLVLAYSTLFLSLSAAVSGLILTNKLRKAPTHILQEVFSDGETPASSCGYEGRLIWVAGHCEYSVPIYISNPPSSPYIAGLLSLIGGVILPVAQVLLYVWLEESNTVRLFLSVITLFALLPIVFVLLPSSNGKHSIVST